MVVQRRTCILKLNTNPDNAQPLENTVQDYLYACNYITDTAWSETGEIETTKTNLHEQTYNHLKEHSDLQTGVIQLARDKAVSNLKSTLAQWSNENKASKPDFYEPTAEFDTRSATFNETSISLATTQGRIEYDYILPEDYEELEYFEYLTNEEWSPVKATLHNRDEDWFVHVGFKREVEVNDSHTAGSAVSTEEGRTVLGVDLGINQIAVTSTGRFWSSEELEHWKKEYEKRRASLQNNGSRSARQNLASVGRKETGRLETRLHEIANEIIEEALEYDCNVIAFEDLTHIRENLGDPSWGYKWAFRQLYENVEYKAVEHSLEVVQVNPENTSKACSTCGFTHEENRGGEEFECLECGYENHADYNAAKNIGLAFVNSVLDDLLDDHTDGQGGAQNLSTATCDSVGVRLNSGIMIPTTGVNPVTVVERDGSQQFEGEFTLKPTPLGVA